MSSNSTLSTKAEELSNRTEEVSKEEIEERLTTLVDEFYVDIAEAERSVCNVFDIDNSADDGESGSNDQQDVAAVEVDEWTTVEVTVVKLFDAQSSSIAQSGRIGDESGTVNFTSWEKSDLPRLEEGQSYRLENVVGDEYNGNIDLKLNSSTEVTELETEVTVDETVEFSGIITAVKHGSGLIKRCSDSDCNHVLKNGRCPNHGEVDGSFDLRLKLAVDTGSQSVEVVADEELTAQLTGTSLEQAEQMAMDALDTTVVVESMTEQVIGRFIQVEGADFDERVIGNEVSLVDDLADVDADFVTPTEVLNITHDGQREPAVMVTPTELNHATHTFAESDDERAPTYSLLPSGVAPNRVVVMGTLTETNDVGSSSEYWQGRIVGFSGEAAFVYAGQYQTDQMAVLRNITPPARIAVIGKPQTWQDDDGETHVSLRPEDIVEIDEQTRAIFSSLVAARTRSRLDRMSDDGPSHADKAEKVYGSQLDKMRGEIREAINAIEAHDSTDTLEF